MGLELAIYIRSRKHKEDFVCIDARGGSSHLCKNICSLNKFQWSENDESELCELKDPSKYKVTPQDYLDMLNKFDSVIKENKKELRAWERYNKETREIFAKTGKINSYMEERYSIEEKETEIEEIISEKKYIQTLWNMVRFSIFDDGIEGLYFVISW